MTLFTTSQPRCAMQPEARARQFWWLGAIMAVNATGTSAADCDLQLSSSVVDYGALSRGELDLGKGHPVTTLGARKLTLTAVCRQATTMTLRFEGEAAALNTFRFANKGWFTVKLSGATLDGNAVQLANTKNLGSAASVGSSAIEFVPNDGISVVALGQLAVGKVLSAHLEIEAYVDDVTTRVRGETILDGRGALTLETQENAGKS